MNEEIFDKSVEVIEGALYFYSNKFKPQGNSKMKIINFDSEFMYQYYNQDFGPLNIGQVTLFCREINE